MTLDPTNLPVGAEYLFPLPTEEAPVPAHANDFSDILAEHANSIHMLRDQWIVDIRERRRELQERQAAMNMEFDAANDRLTKEEAALRTWSDEFCALPTPTPPVDERTVEQIEAMFAPKVSDDSGEKEAA